MPNKQQHTLQPRKCGHCGHPMEFKPGYYCCNDEGCHANTMDEWICVECFEEEDA